MRLLLDTQLLLWAAAAPERLPVAAAALIEDEGNTLLFSAASLWEVAIKAGLGRADFAVDAGVLRRGLVDNGYEELAVTGAHACAVAALPPLHRDPFDRMLVAQALVEGVSAGDGGCGAGGVSGGGAGGVMARGRGQGPFAGSWRREYSRGRGACLREAPLGEGNKVMSDLDGVRAASAKFYAALNKMVNGDSSSMDECWWHEGSVTAMHPIGGRTPGWDGVRESFAGVAHLSTGGQVALKDQVIEVGGDMAYELGLEDGKVTLAGTPMVIDHRVTNVYRRKDGAWRMVHHHTDISPAMLDVLAKLKG